MTSFPNALMPKAQMIETNGVTLEVFVAGEKGKPIVLCHGWPEHAYSWRYQIAPLVEAGYHVIVPNQRGYGASSRPSAPEDYDITQMSGDLVGLLDHFGYKDAIFVGHDWGAIIVWWLSVMHPTRLTGLINMSVPFMARGEREWIGLWEEILGQEMYIVHFNRQPGVADAAFDANVDRVLRGMYRTDQWLETPDPDQAAVPGMPIINIAEGKIQPGGKLMMSEEDLSVFVEAFKKGGFTSPINWYRNFTRNWGILADYPDQVKVPALMIYGEYDMVPKSPTLGNHVSDLEIQTLDCGHWIQQERPEETNRIMLDWLARRA